MNKIKPEIKDDIAETLFIPLLSRAHESHRKDAILKDPMACELVEKIDYDFPVSQIDMLPTLLGLLNFNYDSVFDGKAV